MSQPEREIRVGIVMGSESDLPVMLNVGRALGELGLRELVDFEYGIKSAHRTPEEMMEYAKAAKSRDLEVIIAGAGGSGHLPGMVASETILPVLAVAITNNPDVMNRALGSMIGMPEGTPLAVFQGETGAFNAGLSAASILALNDPELGRKYREYRNSRRQAVVGQDHELSSAGSIRYMAELRRKREIHETG